MSWKKHTTRQIRCIGYDADKRSRFKLFSNIPACHRQLLRTQERHCPDVGLRGLCFTVAGIRRMYCTPLFATQHRRPTCNDSTTNQQHHCARRRLQQPVAFLSSFHPATCTSIHKERTKSTMSASKPTKHDTVNSMIAENDADLNHFVEEMIDQMVTTALLDCIAYTNPCTPLTHSYNLILM